MKKEKQYPLKTCKKCGKKYERNGVNICDKCIRALPDTHYSINISGIIKSG